MNLCKTLITCLACLVLVACQATPRYDNQPTSDSQSIPKLSVQLWSVKDEVKKDFKNTLIKLKTMGFDGVEFAGEFGPYSKDPAGLKAFLAETGLIPSGAHVPFRFFTPENFEDTVTFYKTLGVDTLIVPWDDRAWDPDQVALVVQELNELSLKLAAVGLTAGYHNHAGEMGAYSTETFWDYIAHNTSPEIVLQQDVGWTQFAGKNPIEYVERYPGRTLTTHYKIRLTPEEKQAGKQPIIGQDSIDWLNLLKANISVGGTEWIVVEQEEYPEGMTPMEAVAASKKGLDQYIQQL